MISRLPKVNRATPDWVALNRKWKAEDAKKESNRNIAWAAARKENQK